MSWDDVTGVFAALSDRGLLAAALTVAVGLALGFLASRAIGGFLERKTGTPQPAIVRQLVGYVIVALSLVIALEQIGFDVSVLVGAAGVLTIAVGFAAQTSVSNVISGLFLVAERPFVIGDTVQIGTTAGVVHSIGFMSMTLRTFDNLFVRVPNEMLVKSEITNYTAFPLRRFDLALRLDIDADIDLAERLLLELAARHPLVLEEPESSFLFLEFGPSSYNFRFSVWAQQSDFIAVRNGIPKLVRSALADAGLIIPVPKQVMEVVAQADAAGHVLGSAGDHAAQTELAAGKSETVR